MSAQAMTPQERRLRAVGLLGRLLISGIFVAAGIDKVRNFDGTKRYMKSKHMPMAPAMLGGAITMELGVAPVLALGLAPRFIAPVLSAFLIPTSIIFHDFWNLEGDERKMQSVNFFKNMAIVGGLITLALQDYEKSKLIHEQELQTNLKRPDYLDQVQFEVA